MIEAYVEGVGEVVARLDSLDDRLTKELRTSIAKLTISLQKNVVQNYLQGQALGVRTGRGQRSIQQDVQSSGSAVSGVVSTNVFYMVGWETGWPGRVDKSLAGAKAKFDLSSSSDTFKNGTPKKRPFLVPALKQMAESGAITVGINEAIARAAK